MRLLVDTHVFIWWKSESPRLTRLAREALTREDATVFVSVASAWEMAIKVGSGKLPEAKELLANFETAVTEEGFELLEIQLPHVRLAGLMPSPHRDPFDRLLAAQASIEGLTLVSSDAKIAELGAAVLW